MPLFWVMLSLTVLCIVLYPIDVMVAHLWDKAEKRPLVVNRAK